MRFALIAFAAIVSTNAIKLTEEPEKINAPDPGADDTYKVVTSDPTGTYSPKENMWTGFEGKKTGSEITFSHASTGGHDSINRVASTISW